MRLGLESVWRSRAVIGLGLAELGLNRPAAAAKVFTWLDHASSPPMLRDQAAYWHVQGMLNVGLYAEAGQLVETQVEGYTGSPSPGKNSLCIAAIRAGAALDAERRTSGSGSSSRAFAAWPACGSSRRSTS